MRDDEILARSLPAYVLGQIFSRKKQTSMITYEYECESCGFRFERRQAITEEPVTACPECRGRLRQVVTGGSGFVIKGKGQPRTGANCSFEASGKTCCGQDKRCETPSCEIES